MDTLFLQKQSKVVLERIKSLQRDGYLILFKSRTMTKTMYRLRHRSNGNFITLHVNYSTNNMQQWTNGVLVYNEKIWQTPT